MPERPQRRQPSDAQPGALRHSHIDRRGAKALATTRRGCRSNGQSLRQRMPQPRAWLPSHTHPVAHQEQICR
jgi:hypothetical protein